MADNATSMVLFSDVSRLILKLTSRSDGTGENNVIKVDASTLITSTGFPPQYIYIEKLDYDISGMEVCIHADDGNNTPLFRLNGTKTWVISGGVLEGIPVYQGSGTGDILLSTNLAAPGDCYDIIMQMRLVS